MDEPDIIEVIEAEIEHEQNLPAVRAHEALVTKQEMSVEELVGQRDKIVQAMQAAMVEGVHYGRIPGVQKPSLYKPGAETLNVLFRFAPSYRSEKVFDGDHLTVTSVCTLTHIPTGMVIAEGEGLCSTHESRYAYRQGGRLCPECGQPTIIKGKAEYGGGWLCYGKKGGCGAKWDDGSAQAQEFESAEIGRTLNPDIPDQWNTVLKMADKRALVAAILNGTAASDVFTQDVEDQPRTQEAPKPFDPEKDRLPGAPDGKDVPNVLVDFDPTISWGDVLESASPGWRSRSAPGATDFWRRVGNVIARVSEGNEAGSFPPPAEDEWKQAFAEMFSGAVVEITYKPVEKKPALSAEQAAKADATDDDIPFE